MKKIKVTYAKTNYTDYDFGLFPLEKGEGTIEIDKNKWEEYVIARAKMESLHWDLIQKLPRKLREGREYNL